jgi:hypothetical protein
MPLLISALLGGLLQLSGSLVGRVLISLGFGFAEYQGISALVSTVTSAATGAMSGLESTGFPLIAAWAGFFRLDVHVSMIISAIGVKIALNALGGASVRKLVSK